MITTRSRRSELTSWVFDESTFSFITGHHVKAYKNYFFITHKRSLKIATARARNGRLDFHLITELALPHAVRSVHISNLNDVLVSAGRLDQTNSFYRLNMELIARSAEFPILHGRLTRVPR